MSSFNVDPDIFADASFPLPFRALVLVGLGILGWATNVHGFRAYNIDVVRAMDFGHPPKPQNNIPDRRRDDHRRRREAPPYMTIYAMCLVYFIWVFMAWSVYVSAIYGMPQTADTYKYIASVAILVILAVLICPFEGMFKRHRDQFLHALSRCLFPETTSPVLFSDVVLADTFTSFAKVLGDCWLSFWMLLPGNSFFIRPSDSDWKRWILPSIMSLPYLVRFRQCLIEYSLPSNKSPRPLYNALKYATSFPVIFLSAAQRVDVLELEGRKGEQVLGNPWYGEYSLFRLWLLFALVNSLYSFWWDVTHDWGLNVLKLGDRDPNKHSPHRTLNLPHIISDLNPSTSRGPQGTSTETDADTHGHRRPHHSSLRTILLYPVPLYPLLLLINFILRMSWSIKLSSHLHQKNDGTYTIFFVEVAEIVRRWLWVFIRVEWEVIRKIREGSKAEDDHGLDVLTN